MKPDFRIVKIRETEMWDLPKDSGIKEIWSIYLSDFSRSHFCCEITPSKLLEFLDYDVVFEDHLYDLEHSDKREEILCEFIDGANEEPYRYYHSRCLENPKDGIIVEEVGFLNEEEFLQDYDLEDEEEYFGMLAEAWGLVRDSDCYW